MPAKASVTRVKGTQEQQNLRAAEKDLASCQHDVDRAKRAIAQQGEALKVAEGTLKTAQARLVGAQKAAEK
jgi:hypothetical protein